MVVLTILNIKNILDQINAEEYLGRLVEYCHLKVTCLLRVVETGSGLKI